ncbi:MAG: Verru_Chthon cassette protein A, partial [Chthoniobacterales bacterium]
MKRNFKLRQSGFAMVLVLILVVMAATMAVLFLSGAAQERQSVLAYSQGNEAQHLSQTVVNKVIGQISTATKEGTTADPKAWASQPGMIRTYDTSGNLSKAYKLYSWDNLVAGTSFDPTVATEHPPFDWKTQTAVFTDLNQPISNLYPIVDPTAEGEVDGFTVDPAAPAVSGPGEAPMPVKWLYVLKDGRMVSPTGSGTSVTISGATASNPVVGRVAFWTDDETAKVNINTASEGAFWDWPKAATPDEMQFAGNPPIGGEYNRTPGHPSMTSLSAVFPLFAPGDRWSNVGDYRTKLKNVLGLSARVPYSDASSRGGTFPVQSYTAQYSPDLSSVSVPNASIPPKTNRLYASANELLFQPDRTSQAAAITPEMIQKRNFFLTSQSRAPETTLFETPRVALWPITWPYESAHYSTTRQTEAFILKNPDSDPVSENTWMRAEERLIAFVSTLNASASGGGDPYYFQRQNPDSGTYDYTQIQRNREILSYLRRMTTDNMPGFAGNLVAEFDSALDRDALLANTFNTVRSLVNQYTLNDDGKIKYSFTPVSFAVFKRLNGSEGRAYNEENAFFAVPMNLNLGSGKVQTLGDFPTLYSASIIFYATDRLEPSYTGGMAGNPNDPYQWSNLINIKSSGYPTTGARTT